jgi:N-glycosylase/DNA lyase
MIADLEERIFDSKVRSLFFGEESFSPVMPAVMRIQPFSLDDTLQSGQFFRYTRCGDTYVVQSSGQIFSLKQKRDEIVYDGVDDSFLIRFFRLDDPYDAILKEIDCDPIVHAAIGRYRGMRLIRQDPWECLISYLCSSAKSISHIRFIIESLSKFSGRQVCLGNYIGYDFPGPSSITDPVRARSAGAGFRTRYLVEAGQAITHEQLASLKTLPYEEARAWLTRVSGVGRKVADCVLLYSLDFLQAFPIDTWIRKGLQRFYFGGKRMGEKELERFVAVHFGPLAGYAQLFLYHYWRNDSMIA